MTVDDDDKTAAGRGEGVEAVIAVLRREGAADSLLEQACHGRALHNICLVMLTTERLQGVVEVWRQ